MGAQGGLPPTCRPAPLLLSGAPTWWRNACKRKEYILPHGIETKPEGGASKSTESTGTSRIIMMGHIAPI